MFFEGNPNRSHPRQTGLTGGRPSAAARLMEFFGAIHSVMPCTPFSMEAAECLALTPGDWYALGNRGKRVGGINTKTKGTGRGR
jgi:hypothetical protein